MRSMRLLEEFGGHAPQKIFDALICNFVQYLLQIDLFKLLVDNKAINYMDAYSS